MQILTAPGNAGVQSPCCNIANQQQQHCAIAARLVDQRVAQLLKWLASQLDQSCYSHEFASEAPRCAPATFGQAVIPPSKLMKSRPLIAAPSLGQACYSFLTQKGMCALRQCWPWIKCLVRSSSRERGGRLSFLAD